MASVPRRLHKRRFHSPVQTLCTQTPLTRPSENSTRLWEKNKKKVWGENKRREQTKSGLLRERKEREKRQEEEEKKEVWRAEEAGMVGQRGFVQNRMSKTVLTKEKGGVCVCRCVLVCVLGTTARSVKVTLAISWEAFGWSLLPERWLAQMICFELFLLRARQP